MLTLNGYRIPKSEIKNLIHLKGLLTVRPYIPKVFVDPRFVSRYPVYKESENYIYVPKHYGIEEFGPYAGSQRDVAETPKSYWEFVGAIRPAQEPVVNSFLKPEPHDGIISLQTGGGKTVCALYIASQLRLPALILVHSTFLRDQWVERIRAFLPNARIGTWNEDATVDTMIKDFVIRTYPDGNIKYKAKDTPNFKLIKNLKPTELEQISGILETFPTVESILQKIPEYTSQRDITVGMLQGIMRDNVKAKSFENIGLVIVDECHHIASESFSQTIPKLTSKYMLGLSATPERKDKLMHVINWFLGPILYQSNADDKIDAGVRVEYVEFETDDESFNEIVYNKAGVMSTVSMINKVVEFEARNKLIIELIEDIYSEPDRNVLVLTDRVEHTKKILSMLPEHTQKETGILSSGMKPGVRDEFCASKRILISTYQLCSEGFDVPTLNTLIMATSRPSVEQIVGRILRTDKTKRTISPLIIDIVDSAFRRQFQSRLSLYKERNYVIEKVTLT
jgi:superfamily II DNA or RNA helicase